MQVRRLSPRGFAVGRAPDPVAGPGQVVVAPDAVGICEGDAFRYRGRCELPAHGVVLGHEATGIVTEVGPDVGWLALGTRVATLAVEAFADRVVVRADLVAPISSDLPSWALLGEPVACCVHAMDRVPVGPGTRVAVVGCGFMGLVCIALADRAGADVVALEPLPYRRRHARAQGAAAAVDPTGRSLTDLVGDLGGADVVVEAAGTQSALDTATALTVDHGTLLVVAYHQSGGGTRTVDMATWNVRALDVVNGHVRRTDEKATALRTAVDLLDRGELDLRPLVKTWPLAEVEDALLASIQRPDEVIKAVVVD